jgi:decaprenyl-phosphate phosphoribosyltransferase
MLIQLKGLIALLRIKHWIKNGFVLAPLLFTGAFLNTAAVINSFVAVMYFSMASSVTYIMNDIHDIERDRKHPKKSKTRPLAAGIVTIPMAVVLMIALLCVLASAWILMPSILGVIIAYLVLNVAYTRYLKHQPVLDIFTIATGFVLRVYAGAIALSVPVSGWMFITTLCLALYLASVKRRQELGQVGVEGREVLEKYSLFLVNRYAEMSATGALVFYALFVVTAKPQLINSVPLVLFGLFRYWYVVDSLDAGESPTDVLLADWPLLMTVIAWLLVCGWALWPNMG